MTRIAVFTDIHGNLEALKAILEDIKKESISDIYHLGDAIAIGPSPKETLDTLITHNVHLIKGNHEDYYLNPMENLPEFFSKGERQHQLWVKQQLGKDYSNVIGDAPYSLSLNIEGYSLYLCHYPYIEDGAGFVDYKNFVRDITLAKVRDLFCDLPQDIFLYGHFHEFSDFFDQSTEKRYINPGSAGSNRSKYTHYTILEFHSHGYTVVHKNIIYDKGPLIDKMHDKSVPEKEFLIPNFFGITD